MAGAREHVGPYAEDVHREFGEGPAPGGIAVDAVGLAGIAIAGVQALAKKVDRIEQAVGIEEVRV